MIVGILDKIFVWGGDWLGLPSGATGCIKAMGPGFGCNSTLLVPASVEEAAGGAVGGAR